MKLEYKYNIDVNLNFVTAEIYYEKKFHFGDNLEKIGVCSKTFSGGFKGTLRNYPKEEQLISAKEWAEQQCKIMNKYQ